MRFAALMKAQPVLWAAVGFALANLAWVCLARYAATNPRPAPPRPQPAYTGFGSGAPGVRILAFYTSAFEVTEGEHALLCYGVENARKLLLDPAEAEVRPSLNRCVAVTPKAETTYTLTALGDDGKQASAAVTVRVKPAPPFIAELATSGKQIVRGEPLTLCYNILHAASARLEPLGMPLAAGRQCVRLFPPVTANYAVVATGPGGQDRWKFRVAVK